MQIENIDDRFYFEKVLLESKSAFAIIKMDGVIAWRNSSFSLMYGYSEEDKICVQDICVEPDSVKGVMSALMSGFCANVKMDKRYCRKDKSLFWGRVSVSLVRDDTDLPVAFFIEVENINDKYEKTDEVTKKLRSLSDFAKSILDVRKGN